MNGDERYLALVATEFDTEPQDFVEISAGGNNRLFKVRAKNKDYIAKFYPHDGRLRLERELMAIKLFSTHGLPVPRPYSANQDHRFAIYSFEPGQTKPASMITRAEIELIADFVLAVHQFTARGVPKEYPYADGAFLSYQDYIDLVNARMEVFEAALTARRLHPKAYEFAREVKATQLIQDLIADAVRGLSPEALTDPLPKKWLRLSPIDIGPHNALFDGKRICFIDFEFTGWDEPMRTIAEFANHQANRDIAPALHTHFREYYLANTKLPQLVTDRLPIDDRLMAIIWLTTQLSRLTPERIEGLEFADSNFDLETHIDATIAKAWSRIQQITSRQAEV